MIKFIYINCLWISRYSESLERYLQESVFVSYFTCLGDIQNFIYKDFLHYLKKYNTSATVFVMEMKNKIILICYSVPGCLSIRVFKVKYHLNSPDLIIFRFSFCFITNMMFVIHATTSRLSCKITLEKKGK